MTRRLQMTRKAANARAPTSVSTNRGLHRIARRFAAGMVGLSCSLVAVSAAAQEDVVEAEAAEPEAAEPEAAEPEATEPEADEAEADEAAEAEAAEPEADEADEAEADEAEADEAEADEAEADEAEADEAEADEAEADEADEAEASKPAPSITSKMARDSRLSAYALQKRQVALSVGLLGVDVAEIYAAVGLRYGFGHGIEAGINVAHLGAGIINVSGKWTFLDKEHLGLSFDFAPMYAHGDWVWIASAKQLMAGFDAFVLPFTLTASIPATPWLQFDLATRFTDVEVIGDISGDSLLLDADLAVRQFALFPGVRFHVMERATFFFRAKLAPWTEVPGSVEAEVTLVDGVVVGGRTGGTLKRTFDETYVLTLGARAMVSRNAFLEFAFSGGPPAEKVYSSWVMPKFSFEARF